MTYLFLICICVRILIVLASKYINIRNLHYFGYLAILPAFGFLTLYITGIKKIGAFGNEIWWNRLVHSIFYGLFAYNAIIHNKDSWTYLLADVIFGIITFINYYLI